MFELIEEIDTPYLVIFGLLFLALIIGALYFVIKFAVKDGTKDLLEELRKR